MYFRGPFSYLIVTLAAGAAFACNDLNDSLDGEGGESPTNVPLPELEAKVVPSAAMTRNLSNREYLAVVSDLLGETLPTTLLKEWTPTTQFSGFDAVPWTNLDTKAVHDRADTVEQILDKAVASPKVMTCSVTTPEGLAYATCAKAIVEPFAKRAFGRPLVEAEFAAVAKAYEDGVALAKTFLTEPKAIFTDGVRAALGSVLLAPQAMTRIEPPPSPEFSGERDLDAYELANRLAFMFTGSIPDEGLWAKAENGSLAKLDVLLKEAERLLDTETDTFVQSFMGQWFDFRALDAAEPGSLENTMWTETYRTLVDVVKDKKPVTAILKPGFTYLNDDLAKHYSIAGTFGKELVRVETQERGGILQQGSWLTMSATPLRTSPIHRGRLVQDRLLCKVIAAPDQSLFEKIQEVTKSIPANASVRERVEAHRGAGEVCAGCHRYMDPIGLGLEGFDQRGRLRRAYVETGREVETNSNLLGKPFATFREMNDMLAELPDYQRCAAEKLTVYTTRRVVDTESREDKELLDYLAAPEKGGATPSLRAMVLRLVGSSAFRRVKHGVKTP